MLRYWDSPPQDQPSGSHCQENASKTSQVQYTSEVGKPHIDHNHRIFPLYLGVLG